MLDVVVLWMLWCYGCCGVVDVVLLHCANVQFLLLYSAMSCVCCGEPRRYGHGITCACRHKVALPGYSRGSRPSVGHWSWREDVHGVMWHGMPLVVDQRCLQCTLRLSTWKLLRLCRMCSHCGVLGVTLMVAERPLIVTQ